MSTNAKQPRKRRRPVGVPTALVIVLIAIAIVMGGLLGFVVARRTAPTDDRLARANERIIELENTLNLIGFPVDGNPEEFIFDDSAQSNGAADLAGEPESAGSETEAWTEEDTLLNGTLDENADPVVVAEFDGGQLLSTEVIPEFNDQLTTQVFDGYNADEVADSVLQTVLSDMAGQKLIAMKAAELGLDQITDADLQAINAEADAEYKNQIRYYTAFVSQEGATPEALEAAAETYMRNETGVTRERIVEELKQKLPARKYREHVVKDIDISDEEIQAYYAERLAEQKSAFDEFPETYENAHNDGETLLYNPEGYRAVLDLLIPFEAQEDADHAAAHYSELESLDPLNATDATRIQAIEAELDPMYKPLEEKANQIAERLQAGESFADLMAQYGADPLMAAEPLRSQGYYISDHSFLFSTEFIQGSMILEAPGQVSAPLRSPSGVHLTLYLRDVTPGEVPLDQVRDALKAEALKARQDAYYEEQLSAMLEEAHVKYYPERLQ